MHCIYVYIYIYILQYPESLWNLSWKTSPFDFSWGFLWNENAYNQQIEVMKLPKRLGPETMEKPSNF